METEVYASTYGRVLTIALGVVGVLVVAGVATTRDVRGLVLALAGSMLVAGGGWALFWRPRVEVSDGGVTLINVTRTVHVPWPVLVEAEPGWSLVVRTTRRAWTAWAAPRSSAAASGLRRTARDPRDNESINGQTPRGGGGLRRQRATSDVVAAAITRRQDALLAAGHLDGARRLAEQTGLTETVTWHVRTIATGVALICTLALAATV